MAEAYVNDIAQFLDVTNKENVRILKDKSLIWSKSNPITQYLTNLNSHKYLIYLPKFAHILLMLFAIDQWCPACLSDSL